MSGRPSPRPLWAPAAPYRVRVLVQYYSAAIAEPKLTDKTGESVTATKHGFESRWGHHDEIPENARDRGPGGVPSGASGLPRFRRLLMVQNILEALGGAKI
jgi:hypothetical protein